MNYVYNIWFDTRFGEMQALSARKASSETQVGFIEVYQALGVQLNVQLKDLKNPRLHRGVLWQS